MRNAGAQFFDEIILASSSMTGLTNKMMVQIEAKLFSLHFAHAIFVRYGAKNEEMEVV